MHRYAPKLLTAACLCLSAWIVPAQAQDRCPDGRTLSGKCANPRLVEGVGSRAIDLGQPKISYSAPTNLPSEDRSNSNPVHPHEALNLFTFPPVNSTVTTVTIPTPGGPQPFVLGRP